MSPNEIKRLEQALKKNPGNYKWEDNKTCASYTLNAFQKATQGIENPVHSYLETPFNLRYNTPSQVIDALKNAGRINQTPTYYPAQHSNSKTFWGLK